jgi:hypothetical protein
MQHGAVRTLTTAPSNLDRFAFDDVGTTPRRQLVRGRETRETYGVLMIKALGCFATTAATKNASDAREHFMMDHSRALERGSAKRARCLYTVVPRP